MILNWDETFMNMSLLISMRSKDPNTRVGSVIVKDNKVLGMGYNGMPFSIGENNDTIYPWDKESDDIYSNKHGYVVHSEVNAILNSTCSVKGATIYVSLFPCNECAKIIVQSGIKKVVYLDEWDKTKPTVKASRRILENAGVELVKLENFNKLILK